MIAATRYKTRWYTRFRIATAFWMIWTFSGFREISGQSSTSILPGDLDNYIENVLQTFEVPGMALAVVKDGKVVLTKGYGLKKLGSTDKVDEHTLFFIGSNPKSFTALSLALLVEEGKLKWNEPVVTYLPWFRLSDPYVTQELTVRDLLVHKSGLAQLAGDLLQFPPTTYSRRELAERLKYIPMATSFRSTFAYNNVLYLVAGELIKEVSGMEWEEFVEKRILKKAGMTETISRFSQFKHQANIAAPHARVNDKAKHLEHFYQQGLSDLSNPAGGIASNAVDMANYLLLHLDSGKTATGQRLFSAATTSSLWSGITPMPTTRPPAWIAPSQTDFRLYALGFMLYNYRNHYVVAHGGKLDGFVSNMYMFPSLNLGLAILTNQESSNAYNSVINHIVDHITGAEPYDWKTGFRKQEDNKFARYKTAEQKTVTRRDQNSHPSLPLAAYAGKYEDKWYGDIFLSVENGKLVMRFDRTPLLTGELEHWHYNTFIVRWYNRELRADAFVTFSLHHDGSIQQIRMEAISPLTDASYNFQDLRIEPVNAAN